MKYIKEYKDIDWDDWDDEEFEVINYSKIDNITDEIYPIDHQGDPDYYYVYGYNIENYLNKWYKGLFDRRGECVTYDEMLTIVRTNGITTNRLYERPYNNLSVNIMKYYKDDSCNLHDMKAMIHSLDDSTYGVWFNRRNYNDLLHIRLKILYWVNKHRDNMDGEDFLRMCLSIGADADSVDYN